MRRDMVGWIMVSVVVLSMIAVLPTIGYAQQGEGRFSVQWKDIPVADALGALQRQFGLQYVLPSELGSRRITLSLNNATVTQALQAILSAANLTAVNENGVWHIREVAEASAEGRTYRPPTMGGAMVQPAPYRPTPPGVNVGDASNLGMPGPVGGVPGMPMGLQPGALGTGLTTPGLQGTMQGYSPEDMVFRTIPLKFIDPYVVTDMFGGGVVGGYSSYGGGGYGGYGDYNRGGYGRDRYGSDRYGSDRYRSDRYGSDRYRSDRYGSSRYGSDRYDRGYSRDRYY